MSLPLPTLVCLALSVVSATIYGFALLHKPSGLIRALIKTAGVAALAAGVALWSTEGPLILLVAALAASALGDFLLAFDKKLTLALGILSFLIAQLIYAVTFFLIGFVSLDIEPMWPRYAAIGLVVVSTLAMIVWLWRAMGPLKFGVVPYALAIALMACLALRIDWMAWPAMLGAILFLVSDGVLSAELFKLKPDAPARRLTAPIVWWTYYFAQIGLAAGVILFVAPS